MTPYRAMYAEEGYYENDYDAYQAEEG